MVINMYSIWFYFMPTGTAFEACGYANKHTAFSAVDSHNWFQDEAGNDIYISDVLKQTAVIKICKTA